MATLRQIIEGILKSRIPNPGREFLSAAVESGLWTAVIRGSGTAGTYEIAVQNCRYTRIGRRVFLDLWIHFAAVLTGGGTGYMQITGAPFAKVANTAPIGCVSTSSLDFTNAGAFLTLQHISFGSATSILYLRENLDNAGGTDFTISGVSAGDIFYGSISYETDDP